MSKTEENKNYVTPYAFGVNDALLGKALASPSRRLCAILVDFIVVGLLTFMSATALAASICFVSIIGAFKAKKRATERGLKSLAPLTLSLSAIVSALLVIASFSLSNVDIGTDSADPINLSLPVDAETQTDNDAETSSKQDAENFDGSNDDDSESLMQWIQDTLSNFGSGFGWAAIYFSAITAWCGGQTLGKVLFRIRVVKIDGQEMSLWESFGRYGGYSAGLATGLLGFLQVIWDPNRQAIHDKISETVVLDLGKDDHQI